MVLTKTEFDSINSLCSDRSIFSKKTLKTDAEPCFIVEIKSEYVSSYLRQIIKGELRIEEGRADTEYEASMRAEEKMMKRLYGC